MPRVGNTPADVLDTSEAIPTEVCIDLTQATFHGHRPEAIDEDQYKNATYGQQAENEHPMHKQAAPRQLKQN